MRVCHITPSIPPVVDGLGHYAFRLAETWERLDGINNEFVVCGAMVSGEEEWGVGQVRVLEKNAGALAAHLGALPEGTAVLLHYSGYGYDVSGAPFWLVDGLEKWRAQNRCRPLGIFYHEVWAPAPWWSPRWIKFYPQREVIGRLSKLSHVAMTSTVQSQKKLLKCQISSDRLPVPSNIISSATLPDKNFHGSLRCVIFSQPGGRRRTLHEQGSVLQKLASDGRLEKIVVVGRRGTDGDDASERRQLRDLGLDRWVEYKGECSFEEASEVFAFAHVYLSFYSAEWVCKSGPFMAALAYGCAAVLADANSSFPLEKKVHFLVGSESGALSGEMLEKVAKEGHCWYCENVDWPVTAARIKALLFSE